MVTTIPQGAKAAKPPGASLALHLRTYLFWYATSAIAAGWALGVTQAGWATTLQPLLATCMTVLVFFMIFPMMIGLNLELLPKVFAKPRPVALSLIYNFVLTPLISYGLAQWLSASPELALGFYLVMLIPGSSMAVAYTGMAGGSLEVATIAQVAGFLIVPLVLPFYMHLLGQAYDIHVPLGSLVFTVVTVLILPMILGDMTRRLMIRIRGPKVLEQAKPMLSLIPMLTMLLLIALIFFSKGAMLAENWQVLLPLLTATFVFMAVILALMTWLNRHLGLNYAEHMAVAFVCSGKNNATAIAIAVSVTAFSPLVAVPAATLPLFQILFLIAYLHLSNRIRGYFAAVQTGTATGAHQALAQPNQRPSQP